MFSTVSQHRTLASFVCGDAGEFPRDSDAARALCPPHATYAAPAHSEAAPLRLACVFEMAGHDEAVARVFAFEGTQFRMTRMSNRRLSFPASSSSIWEGGIEPHIDGPTTTRGGRERIREPESRVCVQAVGRGVLVLGLEVPPCHTARPPAHLSVGTQLA